MRLQLPGWCAALTGRGQVIHLKRDRMSASRAATTTVPMKPPMKPSHVFFGDSLISGVRPKKNPAGGAGRPAHHTDSTACSAHKACHIRAAWRACCAHTNILSGSPQHEQ